MPCGEEPWGALVYGVRGGRAARVAGLRAMAVGDGVEFARAGGVGPPLKNGVGWSGTSRGALCERRESGFSG